MKNWSLVLAGILILAVGFVSLQISDLTGKASLASAPKYATTYGQFYPEEISLEVEHASCTWEGDHYEACAQVSWKGLAGYYLKAFVAGSGKNGGFYDSKKIKESPYTFCKNLEQFEGKRNVHAYLYTASNNLKRIDIDTTINCNKDLESNTRKVKKRYSLRLATSDRTRNTGTKTFTGLGGKPVSCKVTGTWKTNNRKNVGVSQSFCHGATGSFNGEFKEGNQFVTNNPNFFDYRDLGATHARDPAPITYDGYTLYTRTCDGVRFEEGRNYVRAKVVSFNEDGFTVDWEYNNVGTRPSVQFLFEVECEIETTGAKYPESRLEPVVEIPSPVSEPGPVVVEDEEIEEQAPRPLIFKLVDWVKSLF